MLPLPEDAFRVLITHRVAWTAHQERARHAAAAAARKESASVNRSNLTHRGKEFACAPVRHFAAEAKARGARRAAGDVSSKAVPGAGIDFRTHLLYVFIAICRGSRTTK